VARTRDFDPDRALDAAVDLFWRRGYEATSMADLVEHLGVCRASLYATFGTKHDLYLRALDRYVESSDPDIVEELAQPGPVLPAVRRILERYARDAREREQPRGCLVVNTAAELLPDDAAAARRVESSWHTLEVAYTSALTRARAQGELPAGSDPRALARFLLVFTQGLRVLGRSKEDPERLDAAVEEALTMLASAE
jgi:TetR/AcrR family transcriptional regulator, transcriptional repressor for nem operon